MKRWSALLVLFLVALGHRGASATERVVIAAGNNLGLEEELPLAFAERDAARFADVMVDIGEAKPGAVRRLIGASPDALLAALEQARASLSPGAMLVVYYSGHGGEQALHMQGQSLALNRIYELMSSPSLGLGLLIIDACRGALSSKGFVPAAPFVVVSQGHRGIVTMRSAGPGGTAFESPQLEAGLFSHHLLSALRGAADRDGDERVSVAEAYDFAYEHTRLEAPLQSPWLKEELEGVGPLVLTELRPNHSLLKLPPGADVHYVVFEKGSRAQFAEAWGDAAHWTRVALPAGQFVVHRSRGASHAVAEVALPFGGTRELASDAFSDLPFAELAQRGGDYAVHPHRISAAGGLALTDLHDTGGAAALSYSFGGSGLLPTLSASLTRREFRDSGNELSRRAFSLAVGLEYREVFARISISASLGAAAALLQQRLRRRGYAADHDVSLGLGPALRAGLALPLTAQLSWEINAGLLPLFFEEDRELPEPSSPAAPSRTAPHHLATETVVSFMSGLGLAF